MEENSQNKVVVVLLRKDSHADDVDQAFGNYWWEERSGNMIIAPDDQSPCCQIIPSTIGSCSRQAPFYHQLRQQRNVFRSFKSDLNHCVCAGNTFKIGLLWSYINSLNELIVLMLKLSLLCIREDANF